MGKGLEGKTYEVSWFVEPRRQEVKGRTHSCLGLTHEGKQRSRCLTAIVLWSQIKKAFIPSPSGNTCTFQD